VKWACTNGSGSARALVWTTCQVRYSLMVGSGVVSTSSDSETMNDSGATLMTEGGAMASDFQNLAHGSAGIILASPLASTSLWRFLGSRS